MEDSSRYLVHAISARWYETCVFILPRLFSILMVLMIRERRWRRSTGSSLSALALAAERSRFHKKWEKISHFDHFSHQQLSQGPWTYVLWIDCFFWKKCILPRPFLNPRIPACFVCFNGGTACLCSSFRSWWVRSILPSFSTFAVKTVALWLISSGLYCDSWWWWGRGCCWWWWWWWRRQQHCHTDAGGDNYW